MREIPLTRGYIALVDDADFERVSSFRWYANLLKRRDGTILSVYAQRWGRSGEARRVLLHRFILDPPNGIEVDHRSGDTLDCRRENLRVATRQQNAANMRVDRSTNTSGFKGVSASRGKWLATIQVSGKSKNLGRYPTAREAAIAYNHAAVQSHGEFARLNVI